MLDFAKSYRGGVLLIIVEKCWDFSKGDYTIEDILNDLKNIQLEDMEIDLNMDFKIDVELDGLDLTLLQELEA